MSDFIPAAKPLIGDEERQAVDRVLRSGMIAQGPEVATFEREFSEQLVPGVECVAVSSGTAALHLGMLAAGIGPGDEVIVPSFTFAATANSVALTGATPVFADIEPHYFCLDPASVRAAITPRTRAILPVHLYGQPADMDALGALAQEFSLALFEDAAQAHGAKLGDAFVGGFGGFGAFSLYPTKNMTSGEGGMVTTSDGRAGEAGSAAAQPGHGAPLRKRGDRLQPANDRRPCGDRTRPVGQAGRLDETAAGERRVPGRPPRRGERSKGASGRHPRRTTSTPSGWTVTATAWSRRCTTSTASARASTIRFPTTSSPALKRFALELELPGDGRAAAEVISLPVHPALLAGRPRAGGRGRERRGEGGCVSMTELRAGVIGIGAMGRHHVRVLRELEGVDLVAVADAGGDRFGVAPGYEVGRYVEDLIAAKLDMAVVAVPTAFHEEVAITLAEAGIPTLVEKPVAASVAAAERVRDAFARAGVFAGVGHIDRFNPAVAELRRRVAAGDLGAIYQISTARHGAFPARITDVGVVKDLATHDINTAQWVAGSDYRRVAAQVAHRTGREHEDMVSVTASLDNGVLVNHLVDWLSPRKVRRTTVTGERGALVADTAEVSLTFWANGSMRHRMGAAPAVPRGHRGRHDPLRDPDLRTAEGRGRGVPGRRARGP